MGTTFVYTYQNENDLREYIHSHHHDFSGSLLIQVYVSRWTIGEMDRLRRLLATLLPHAVMIGCNSAIHKAKGVNGEPLIYFTVMDGIKMKSSLLKHGENESIHDFAKGLAFDKPKAAILIAAESGKKLDQCASLFDGHHPHLLIAGETAGKNSFVFTDSDGTRNGIAAVTFSGKDLEVQLIGIKHPPETNRMIKLVKEQFPANPHNQHLGKSHGKMATPSQNSQNMMINEDAVQPITVIKMDKDGAVSIHEKLEQNLPFSSLMDIHVPYEEKDREKAILFGFHHSVNEGFSASLPASGMVCRRQIVKIPGRPTVLNPFMHAYVRIRGKDDAKQAANHHPPYFGQNKDKTLLEQFFHSGTYCDSIIKNHSDIIFTTDANGFFKMVNPAFTKAFGKKVQQLKGISWLEFFQSKNKPRFQNAFEKVLTGKAGHIQIEVLSEKGANIFHIHMMPVMDGNQCREILFFGRNITEQRKMEEKLEKLVYYDGNTGLPNQRKLEQILNQRMKRAKREKRSFPVLFIKMDRIKTVNDAFGHRAGDEARILLAERIQSVLPRGSFLGRFSTDTFTVLPGGKSDPDAVMALCQKIVEATQEPLQFENQEFYIASSIGISVYPFDGQDYASLMKNADAALSRTEAGTNRNIVFYLNEMNEEMIERVELERSLRKAIEQDEFFLAYQPIINPVTKEIVACEALLRWEHPKWGSVPPMKFIPIAEETGMIHALGKWILKTACSQVKEWQKQGFENISASVNVSAYQLQNNRFIDNIKQALEHSGLEPRYLHLELTESVMIDKSLKTVDMLRELMEMGVNISIDDFGTGYSSLSYLKHFPVHSLKIDRSFIQNLNSHSPDLAIVHAILTMGHGLGLRIVAEGIETKEQLRMLTSLGCDLVQGYLIERPLEARRFTHWLKSRHQNLNL